MIQTHKRKRTMKKTNQNYQKRPRLPPIRNGILKLPGSYVSKAKSEVKSCDVPPTATAFRSTAVPPQPVLMNIIQQGNGVNNRIGSIINMKSLHLRGVIDSTVTVTTQNQQLRMMVIYDRNPNGNLPLFSDIISGRYPDNANGSVIYSEINIDNRERFVVLRDKYYTTPWQQWNANTLVATEVRDEQQFTVNEHIKMKGLSTIYNSTSNPITSANINSGAVYLLLFMGSSQLVQDGSWGLAWTARFRYTDA